MSFDPVALHPLAGLDAAQPLDYIVLDEQTTSSRNGVLPSRGWTDDLTYGAGTAYLGGAFVGVFMGLREGFNKELKVNSRSLRTNAILNAVGRRAPFLGNSAGCLSIMYTLTNSALASVNPEQGTGTPALVNSLLSAATTGFLFRSASGLKTAGISAGVMTTLAGIWAATKRSLVL